MEKIVVKNSFPKNLLFSLLCLAVGIFFACIGFFYLGTPKIAAEKNYLYWIILTFLWLAMSMFWLLTIGMLGGGYLFIRAAFDSTTQIIFDEEGIFSKTFSSRKVFWNEIEQAFLIDSNTIGLKLNNEEKYLSEIKSSKFYNFFPGSVFNLNFLAVDMKVLQAMKIITSQIERNQKLKT